MKLQEGQFKTESFSDNINQTANSSVIQMSKTPVSQNENKETFFSEAVKFVLGLLFVGFGVLLAIGIIGNWCSFWTTFTQGISAIILLADSISCIVLGVSLWREKDRNYIMSVFSALVALASMVVAIVK